MDWSLHRTDDTTRRNNYLYFEVKLHDRYLLPNAPPRSQASTGGRTSIHSAGPTIGTENKATFASSGSIPLRRMSSRIGSTMAALSTQKSSVEMWASFELQNSSKKFDTASGSAGQKGQTGGRRKGSGGGVENTLEYVYTCEERYSQIGLDTCLDQFIGVIGSFQTILCNSSDNNNVAHRVGDMRHHPPR